MSFKTLAAEQDHKRQEGAAAPARAKPEGLPSAPTPQQAPAQTTPSNEDRKAG